MKTGTAWLVYSLLRVGFFAVPFAIFYAIGWHWLLAAVLATLIAAALSVIFLSKPREQAAISIQAWRDKDRMHDDIVEDAAIEGIELDEDALGETQLSETPLSETQPSKNADSEGDTARSERERNAE